MSSTKNLIKELAVQVGFDLVGIASIKLPPAASYFSDWLVAGYAADMNYLARRKKERFHPEILLPTVRSIIVCAVLYNHSRQRSIDLHDANKVWISRYAWGEDYHVVVGNMLDDLSERLQSKLATRFRFRNFVDTGPVLERVFAYNAGLGWFGKNSCLIHPQLGSYFFLGVILTDLDLAPDNPLPDRCGTCHRCQDACPTQAIMAPRVVDSRKCVSYQTIENRGEIPIELRARLGGAVFGCDICQEVCPWNRKAPLARRAEFTPREFLFQPDITGLFQQITENYSELSQYSPLKRIKQLGLLRNLIITIGNCRQPELLSLLHTAEIQNNNQLAAICAWARQQLARSESSDD